MENRIEQQPDVFADRTSAATMRANQLRLYWALFAAALLKLLRQCGLAGTELERAQFGTIRELQLKVAAVVRVSVRRIWGSVRNFVCRSGRACKGWRVSPARYEQVSSNERVPCHESAEAPETQGH